MLTQHVEAINSEQRGVALSAREDVKRRMAEANVSYDLGAFKQTV